MRLALALSREGEGNVRYQESLSASTYDDGP